MSTTSTSGWNRPQQNAPKATPKKPNAMRGVVAGLVVVALAVVCAVVFLGKGEKPVEKVEKERGRIKEVTPAAASTNAVPAKKKLTPEQERQAEIDRLTAMYAGKEMPKSVRTRIYYLKYPPTVGMKVKVPHSYLRHPSERQIASVVLAKPGTEFLDVPQYGESFNLDFVNALVDKIEIEEDDNEEVRNVKNSVTDIKHEISRICRAEGKKPNEVMNEYAKTMYDLGKFAKDIRQLVIEKRMDDSLSDDDVKDFFTAANKMLSDKGLEPMKVPSLAHRGMFLANRAARLEAERLKNKNNQ